MEEVKSVDMSAPDIVFKTGFKDALTPDTIYKGCILVMRYVDPYRSAGDPVFVEREVEIHKWAKPENQERMIAVADLGEDDASKFEHYHFSDNGRVVLRDAEQYGYEDSMEGLVVGYFIDQRNNLDHRFSSDKDTNTVIVEAPDYL